MTRLPKSESAAPPRKTTSIHLFVPPGYKGRLPASGYYVVHPRTFSIWLPWRSFLVDGDPKPGIELVKKHTKLLRRRWR